MEGGDGNGTHTHTQKQVDPKKMTLFVIEEYIEVVKKEEKDVPDLLELITRPTDAVKEELRRILSQMGQFRAEI